MQAEGNTDTWTITSPLTLELDIDRANCQGFGQWTLKVYNLGADARSDLYRDICDQSEPRTLTLNAGYASWQSGYGPQTPRSFPTVCSGQIWSCFSTRVGPSWLTTITGWDGGWDMANSSINAPLSSFVSWYDRIEVLAKSMTNLKGYFIDKSLTANVSRGVTFNGNPWQQLCELAIGADADLFVDLGILYMVPKGQSVQGLTAGLTEIDSDHGLLNTPVKQQYQVSFDMLFEPRLLIGQQLILTSQETENNGTYSVQRLHHAGVISDGVDGDLITSVTCWNPAAQPAT